MELMPQPNRWSCLPTAFCMVSGIRYEYLMDLIGHDGSEIIFPDLDEPVRRRSFHIEEIQYAALSCGFFLVPYVPLIHYALDKQEIKEFEFFKQFALVLEVTDGIMLGEPIHKTTGHAVAWSSSQGLIYDPNGTKYPGEGNFTIETFYGVKRCMP